FRIRREQATLDATVAIDGDGMVGGLHFVPAAGGPQWPGSRAIATPLPELGRSQPRKPALSPDTRDSPLAPLPQQAWVFLVARAAALVLAGLLLPAGRTVPAPAWPMIPFGLALLLVPLALALRRRRLTIHGDELVVAATFY